MPRAKREGIQLAYPVDEGRISRLGDQFYIQPKLNGERIKCVPFNDEPVFISSYGNEFKFLDHLRGQVLDFWTQLGSSMPLDGEGYVHGWSRDKIDSCLRRSKNYNPLVRDLEFHIFDLPMQIPQDLRIGLMYKEFKPELHTHLKRVPTFIANQEDWLGIADIFLEQGFEGAVLRRFTSEYVEKRTVNMLKYKPTEPDCYEIVGMIEAISQEGEPKGMIGAFEVIGKDQVEFKVGAGKLSHNKRIQYWRDRFKILDNNMWLSVKQGKILTDKGIPTVVVAVDIVAEPDKDSRF